jgi:hypothetical protein
LGELKTLAATKATTETAATKSKNAQILNIPRENEQHKNVMQKGFFIKLKQNPHTTEVTTLPPSFDWNKKN